MKRKILVLCGLLLFCTISNGFAKMISDAPNPYGTASHDTAEWQMLGSRSDVDDGVWWSTDGGSTWGHDAVYVGDEIEFKFALWSAGYGNHDYDQIKAWVDWDNSGSWNNDSSEVIIAEKYDKPKSMIVDDTVYGFDPSLYAGSAETNYFFTGTYYISEDMIDGLWLRARAQCNHIPYDTMTPYGNLWQGEVEDWFIEVSPVPEPATMMLLGVGLIGLAGASRKKLFKN